MEKNDLVYICSPLSAPTWVEMLRNMRKAAYYSDFVAEKLGCRAIAPHSFLPEYLRDEIPEERAVALDFGLSVLKISKAIVICGERISSGMEGEIRMAKKLEIPVYRLMEGKKEIKLYRMEEESR